MTLLRGALLLAGVRPLPKIAGLTAEFPAFLRIQQSMPAAASSPYRSRTSTTKRSGAIDIEGA